MVNCVPAILKYKYTGTYTVYMYKYRMWVYIFTGEVTVIYIGNRTYIPFSLIVHTIWYVCTVLCLCIEVFRIRIILLETVSQHWLMDPDP